MPVRKSLTQLRKEVDLLDEKLQRLLTRRARLAQQIGQAKNRGAKSVLDVAREKSVLRAVRSRNDGPLRDEAVEAVFREIISACRASQEPTSVAFLGPAGTFSNAAAIRQFGHVAAFVSEDTIADVFVAVETGRARYGVVPIENTTEGAVTPTLDALADTSLRIVAELDLKVDPWLLSSTGDRSKVKSIASHPQPLAQCRRYLARNFPGVPLQPMSSTASAAQLAAAKSGTAAIAGAVAADVYGLEVIAKSIQDQPGNVTRFLVIGSDPQGKPSGDDRTSLVVLVRDDVGILGRILQPFTKHEVNLSMIESRPLLGRPWEYRFFVDVAGHVADTRLARALGEIEEIAISTKVLGSYPVAT